MQKGSGSYCSCQPFAGSLSSKPFIMDGDWE